MKKFALTILSLVLICCIMLSFVSCNKSYDDPTKISFKSALSYDYLKSLDGTPVTINGYMATSSPLDGSYMYLMNLPYQSCPFCVPNTNELSNTMAVYSQSNKPFEYTTQAIKITGILKVSENKDKFFTDRYGYEFNFKIVDAYYEILDETELGDKSVWAEIANSDIITDIYKMYDYLYFSTHWYTYTAKFEGGEDYLWPENAIYLIKTENAQFNYGYQEDYFDILRAKVRAVNATELEPLIENINAVEALSKQAVADLERGYGNTTVYKPVTKYSKDFNDTRIQYEYNSNELQEGYSELFADFSEWMSSFEY